MLQCKIDEKKRTAFPCCSRDSWDTFFVLPTVMKFLACSCCDILRLSRGPSFGFASFGTYCRMSDAQIHGQNYILFLLFGWIGCACHNPSGKFDGNIKAFFLYRTGMYYFYCTVHSALILSSEIQTNWTDGCIQMFQGKLIKTDYSLQWKIKVTFTSKSCSIASFISFLKTYRMSFQLKSLRNLLLFNTFYSQIIVFMLGCPPEFIHRVDFHEHHIFSLNH